jgi:hypothetical protein
MLLEERTPDEIIRLFTRGVVVVTGTDAPRLEPSDRIAGHTRLTAVIRLDPDAFDILMNGRCGYRAQYYVDLEVGRRFNRSLIDGVVGSLQRAWPPHAGAWDSALRSLNEPTAKLWPQFDDEALTGQPRLMAAMWVTNCRETDADEIGTHLFSTNPPTIEVKGGWISDRPDAGTWLSVRKRCRDELLRCFGFT